jgi:hypothetical protein
LLPILLITPQQTTRSPIITKRQQRDYYRQVNHVAVEGPITQTKWSHIPITFLDQDINLASFRHTNIIVITVHIDRWDVTKILILNDSQAKILFLSAFKKMSYDKKQLKEPTKPLYGFNGKRIELVGVITLLVSYGTPQNPCIEYITFDMVDMLYPYNAIFGRGLLNTFKTTLHSGYLCLKVPATIRIIFIFCSQKDARNIEQGFVPGHKNVYFLREEPEQHQQSACPLKQKLQQNIRMPLKLMSSSKKVPLDPRVPNRVVCIGTDTS